MSTLQLSPVVFHQPATAGEVIAVSVDYHRLTVRNQNGDYVPVTLSLGLANLYQPRAGDYLVQYPQGHLQVMSAEQFVLKQVAGGANVS